MKLYSLRLGILLLGLTVVFSACKKNEDDDNDTPSKTNKEYLTAGFWKTTGMTIDPGVNVFGTVITDIFEQWEDCEKDDLIKFNSDGSITDDEGATKCDTNDPQTQNDGTWVMSSDNKSVTIDYPDEDPITVDITSINDQTFKGSYTAVEDFGSGPITYTYTVTMKRQ